MPYRNYTPKTQTSATGSDTNETDKTSKSERSDQSGSGEPYEVDRAALMSPGPIEVRNNEHARMIRATGNEDNPRIVGLENYPDAMPRDDDDNGDENAAEPAGENEGDE